MREWGAAARKKDGARGWKVSETGWRDGERGREGNEVVGRKNGERQGG